MAQICLKIVDKDWKTLAVNRGDTEVNLVYSNEYKGGEHIVIELEEKNAFYHVQLDDARASALLYLKDNVYYDIPFGEKRINMSPKTFMGDKHVLCVRQAKDFEVKAYRNLAFNTWDQHGDVSAFPHASANVETRGESVFAAMNAIDGVTVSNCHGEWPYQSWGINRRDDACMRIDFGRMVETDRIVIYTRADYPHDNWWKQVTISFSDGTSMDCELIKTGSAQEIRFEPKKIEWLVLEKLIKADDPSPFPALVQMEVWGCDILS